MGRRPVRPGPTASPVRLLTACGAAALLAGCVQTGDFGRPRPTLLTEVGEATGAVSALRGEPVSTFVHTDDEAELRNRAWRFLMPAHERAWFDRALAELTRTRILPASMHPSNPAGYWAALMGGSFRSPASRYRRLGEDAVADAILIGPFAEVAGRVVESDRVRLGSLPYVHDLGVAEIRDAAARVAENRCLVAWVRREARARAAGYRYALEHVLVEAPQTEAIGAERAVAAFERRLQTLADFPVVAPAGICPD